MDCKNKKGDKCAINNGDCIGEFECERAKLLDEVLELKQEVEIRDNLSETYRKEALSWANIANECQKDNKHLNDLLDNALKEQEEFREENERLKFKLDTVEADYEADEIEIEDLKNKLNLLTTANNHLLQLDKYRQKELETKAEATKANIHNLALLSKANKTLQEIKAIAEKLMADNLCNNCDGIGLDANCQDTGCPYYQMDNILQKITKAEEE